MINVVKQNDKAVLTLYGEVGRGDFTGVNVSRTIGELEKEYKVIDIRLHTPGGSVFEGNVICNTLKNSKAEINIYIDGIAASMGAIILTAAKRVYIAENGFVMIHSPYSGGVGNAKELEIQAGVLRSMEADAIKCICKKTGKPEDEIKRLFSGDENWFDAEQAKKLGIVDEIIPGIIPNIKNSSKDGKYNIEEINIRFSASLNYYSLKQGLIKLIGLKDNIEDRDIISAVSKLVKPSEAAIQKALSLNIIDAALATNLRNMGENSPEELNKFLERLEQNSVQEYKQKVSALFKKNWAKLSYIQPSVVNRLRVLAEKPENFEVIQDFIEQLSERQTFTSMIQSAGGMESRANWTLEDYRKKDPRYLRDNPKFYEELMKNEQY